MSSSFTRVLHISTFAIIKYCLTGLFTLKIYSIGQDSLIDRWPKTVFESETSGMVSGDFATITPRLSKNIHERTNSWISVKRTKS